MPPAGPPPVTTRWAGPSPPGTPTAVPPATSYGLSDGYDTTRTADEDGNDVTTRYTDGWDNLTKVAQDSAEHPGQQTAVTYAHDVLGEQTSVTDPHGNTETTTWNMLGQKTADNDPDRGLTSYRYDPAGNLTRTQDARGRVTTMQYDALNRLRASTDVTTTASTGHGPTAPAAARTPDSSPPKPTPPPPGAPDRSHTAGPTTCSATSRNKPSAPAA